MDISKGTMRVNGRDIETTIIAFGTPDKPRSVEVRDVTIEDQWDLDEIAPANAGSKWRMMSLIAMTTRTIDNVPGFPMASPPTRADLRLMIARLGEDGIVAVAQATADEAEQSSPAPADAEAAHRAQVGNLPETAPSVS